MDKIVGFVGSLIWMAGIVLAKGFWSTFFSIFFPPWSIYLVIEKVLQMSGALN